jgi:hypothetical protein
MTATDATLLDDLSRLLGLAKLRYPMRPLQWVSKSHAELAVALQAIARGPIHRIAGARITSLRIWQGH